MKYLIVYEKSSDGWGAYAPDLPGLGIAGRMWEETKQLIREAIEFHLEGIGQHGDPIPDPNSQTEYVTYGMSALDRPHWREPAVEPPCNELKADS